MGKGAGKKVASKMQSKAPLTSGQKAWKTRYKNKAAAKGATEALPLAQYAGKGFRVSGRYKGKNYVAKVTSSGRIRYEGKLYRHSPTSAAIAIVGQHWNGWAFWRYLENGEWVRLRELRKKR